MESNIITIKDYHNENEIIEKINKVIEELKSVEKVAVTIQHPSIRTLDRNPIFIHFNSQKIPASDITNITFTNDNNTTKISATLVNKDIIKMNSSTFNDLKNQSKENRGPTLKGIISKKENPLEALRDASIEATKYQDKSIIEKSIKEKGFYPNPMKISDENEEILSYKDVWAKKENSI